MLQKYERGGERVGEGRGPKSARISRNNDWLARAAAASRTAAQTLSIQICFGWYFFAKKTIKHFLWGEKNEYTTLALLISLEWPCLSIPSRISSKWRLLKNPVFIILQIHKPSNRFGLTRTFRFFNYLNIFFKPEHLCQKNVIHLYFEKVP